MTGELIPTGVTFGVGRNSLNNQFSGTAEFNNIILESGANFSGGTGGGALFSGGTDLYNIFSTGGGGDVTRVQGGTNIATGGTENLPIINLENDISLTSVQTTQGFSGGQGTNTTSYLGRTAIGYGTFSQYAWFSHIDSVTQTGYALVQSPNGSTTINATLSGDGISFRLDNASVIKISGNTGYVGINTPAPSERLHVVGSIKMVDGNQGYGKIPYDTGDGTMEWSAFTFSSPSSPSTFDYGTTATTLGWDVLNQSNSAKVILSGNVTLNVLNAVSGGFGTLKITQDGVGSHSLTLGTGTHRVANGGGGSITLTSTPSAIDIITFFYDGSVFNWNAGYNYS